jgi:hypothetical protein
MMKDDVLLIAQALKAFTDIANILTHEHKWMDGESQFPSPVSTACGYQNTPVDRLCPNRTAKPG